MSDKNKRAIRRANTKRVIKKQISIAKAVSPKYAAILEEKPNKVSKRHALSCGNPHCVMCGNPRKFYKETTLQEKKFDIKCRNADNEDA